MLLTGERAWVDRLRARSICSAVPSRAPPPLVVMTLLPLKLMAAHRPKVPALRPLVIEPRASAASSTIGTSYSAHTASMAW